MGLQGNRGYQPLMRVGVPAAQWYQEMELTVRSVLPRGSRRRSPRVTVHHAAGRSVGASHWRLSGTRYWSLPDGAAGI